MRKPVVAVAAGASVFTLVAAGAATLSVNGFVPQSTAITTSCQSTPVDVTSTVKTVQVPYNDTGYYDEYPAVTSVTISGISINCEGQELGVSLEVPGEAGGNRIFAASGSTTISDAGTETITFVTNPPTVDAAYDTVVDPAAVTAVYVTIAGAVVYN